MRRLFFAVLGFFALVGIAEAAQTTCGLSPGFALLKEYDAMNTGKGYSWTIIYRGRTVYVFDADELHDIFGGSEAAIPSGCGNILVNADNFAFRVGRENDLLVAFGIEPGGPSGLLAVTMLKFYPHDFPFVEFRSEDGNVLVRWGREQDEFARFCWNPKGDFLWWHNGDHRAGGYPPCQQNNWYWGIDPAHGSAGVRRIEFQ